jgi:hypothetical protein
MMSDSGQIPADGIPPRFRNRSASIPGEKGWQARVANIATDQGAIDRFRRRILDDVADLESLDVFLTSDRVENESMKIDGECVLVFSESGDVVASARMIPLERLQAELGEFLNGRRLAEQLGRDLVNVAWSQHVLIDPEVPEAAVAIRRGWNFDICLCIESNAVRRESIGFSRLGLRIDRTNKAPLEILYREIEEQPEEALPAAVVMPPRNRD